MNVQHFLAAVLATALTCSGISPAQALGGDALIDAPQRFESRAVMVLGSRGNACTGTVLSRTVVITAGHCVAGSAKIAVAYRESGSPVLQEVREVVRHPEFKQGARVSIDLAMVRLRLPLPARFAPVIVDDDSAGDDVGSRQVVVGFGLSREGVETSAGTLRAAEVKVLPRYYPRYFRLGTAGLGLAICKGDSGGPVFSEGLGGLTLTGVVYGKEAADGRACGTIAQAIRIAPQKGWIDGLLARWRE
jgi:secreted trypsin-like serine protease